MYGTTMKNYNVNRASGSFEESDNIYTKKRKTKENRRAKKVEDTRYVNLESTADIPTTEVVVEPKETESGFSRKDFPIPSVIITVLLTMVLLVVGAGLLGL